MKLSRKRKIIGIAILLAIFAFTVAVLFLVGRPLLEFVQEPREFRAWVDEKGLWGRVAFVLMVAFQVVVAIIPGEPLEIGAGYAFGALEGTVLCLLGILLGSVAVFLPVKKWGMRFVTLFISEEKFRSLKFLQNEKRLNLVAFVLFFIPGTPKDVMTYFVGLTPMKLPVWIFITLTARIPSVITSTVGGDAVGSQNYGFAILVFAITAVVSLTGLGLYSRYLRKREKEGPKKLPLKEKTAEEH